MANFTAGGTAVGETNPSIEPGDHEQRQHAEQQADRGRPGVGDRVAARQRAGNEDPAAEDQPGAAGDEDGRQLQHAVRRDEAPELEAHAGAVAGAADHADQQAR